MTRSKNVVSQILKLYESTGRLTSPNKVSGQWETTAEEDSVVQRLALKELLELFQGKCPMTSMRLYKKCIYTCMKLAFMQEVSRRNYS